VLPVEEFFWAVSQLTVGFTQTRFKYFVNPPPATTSYNNWEETVHSGSLRILPFSELINSAGLAWQTLIFFFVKKMDTFGGQKSNIVCSILDVLCSCLMHMELHHPCDPWCRYHDTSLSTSSHSRFITLPSWCRAFRPASSLTGMFSALPSSLFCPFHAFWRDRPRRATGRHCRAEADLAGEPLLFESWQGQSW
jgi:hypothetical protein